MDSDEVMEAIDIGSAIHNVTKDDENVDIITDDPLLLSLLILSSLSLTLVLLNWTYLLYSAYKHPATRPPFFFHQVLLCLLIGSCYGIAHVTLDLSSISSCSITVLIPISYTMLYSTLLVRLVYLHSLHKSVHLPILYQALLFFICVLVQLSLSTQNILLSEETSCPHPHSLYSSPISDLLSLSYSFFLLISLTFISTMLMNTQMYMGEAWTIWILSILTMTVWICWGTIAMVYQEYYMMVKCKWNSLFSVSS